MIKFRVILKVSYYDSAFEFDNAKEATDFAEAALRHMVSGDDSKKTFINMQVVDVDAEAAEQAEEE